MKILDVELVCEALQVGILGQPQGRNLIFRMWCWPPRVRSPDWLHLLRNNVKSCVLKDAHEINSVPRSVGCGAYQ